MVSDLHALNPLGFSHPMWPHKHPSYIPLTHHPYLPMSFTPSSYTHYIHTHPYLFSLYPFIPISSLLIHHTPSRPHSSFPYLLSCMRFMHIFFMTHPCLFHRAYPHSTTTSSHTHIHTRTHHLAFSLYTKLFSCVVFSLIHLMSPHFTFISSMPHLSNPTPSSLLPTHSLSPLVCSVTLVYRQRSDAEKY